MWLKYASFLRWSNGNEKSRKTEEREKCIAVIDL